MRRRLLSRALVGASLYVAVVSAFTALKLEHELKSGVVSASPQLVGAGQLWRLVTNGLLVCRPVILSLVSFAIFALVAAAICGGRVFVFAALLGHIGSTLLAYLVLDLVRLTAPGTDNGLVHQTDYGVSAVQAALLGAVATTLWLAHVRGLRGRLAIVLACCVIGVIAWQARPDLTLLDTDHGFAFAIGIAVVALRLPARFADSLTLLRRIPQQLVQHSG
jgi:hypothetical protein